MKQLSFLAGEGKDGNERENDDHHREEDRAPHLPSRFQCGLQCLRGRQANRSSAHLTPHSALLRGRRGRVAERGVAFRTATRSHVPSPLNRESASVRGWNVRGSTKPLCLLLFCPLAMANHIFR